MANWSAYKEKEIGLPVFKRAKHGLHFKRSDGLIQAEFTGKPIHYLDGGLWKPIDTKPLLRKDGSYGCPHSDVVIMSDGTVQVGTYAQRAALISPQSLKVDGDRLVREFSGGRQFLYITENGYRQEIVLDKLPDLKKVGALIDTVSGVLPSKYTLSTLTAKDADDNDISLADSKTLVSVLESAKYPLVIDPDFYTDTSDTYIVSENTVYATARSTSNSEFNNASFLIVGQNYRLNDGNMTYYIYRAMLKFDTSSIGASSTVTQVNLSMREDTVSSGSGYNIEIRKYDWSSGTREQRWDGVITADLDDAIWKAATITAQTRYTSGNLSTAWVSKTGTTYYGLTSSLDASATAPSGAETATIYSANESGTGSDPYLSVTYTSGTFIPVNMMSNMQNLTAGMRG